MEHLLILAAVLLPPLIFFLLHKHINNAESRRVPRGPPGLPFIGNFHQLDSAAPHRSLWELSKKYGPFMSMKIGSRPTLVISSAKYAKEVLKTHDLSFCSRPMLVGLKTISYNCSDMCASPYNDNWREIRRICATHLFSSKKVLSFRPIREEEVSGMIKNVSNSSKLINLSEILMLLTSTITCRVAFGKKCDNEGCERSMFQTQLKDTQAAMGTIFFSDVFPMMGWVDRLTGMHGRLQKTVKNMDVFLQGLIEEHLKQNRPKSMDGDLIDVLLQMRRDQLSSFDITLDHIKAILVDIILGGTDTGTATVVWAMTWLMKNPRVMKKVQEEVRRKTYENNSIIDEDHIQQLSYLKAVIKETMRLSPPVPLLVPRETIETCVIDGYTVSPKTFVYVNAWAVGRDPESWKDPEEFYPERFVGSDIDYKGNNFEFIPFGAGRRICPGLILGAVQVDLMLGNLLYWFDWELPIGMKTDDIDTEVLPGLTMHKKIHLCLFAKNYVSLQ